MKSWFKKEWKDKRAEILKVRNKCEKCGSTENLAIHHAESDVDYFRTAFLRISRERKLQIEEKGKKVYLYSYSSKRIWQLFFSKYPEIIEESKERGNKIYMDCENILVLCKRCHFILERFHKHLCQTCRKKYTKIGFDECWECHIKTEKEFEELCNKEDEELKKAGII